MNKANKKHWYDKPLHFLYFFFALLPIFMLLGNYITCQVQFSQWKSTQTDNNKITEENPSMDGDGNINLPINYGMEGAGYYTPLQNAIWWTNYDLNFYYDIGQTPNQEGETHYASGIMPPFIQLLKEELYKTLLFTSDSSDAPYQETYYNLDYLIFNIVFWELYITLIYILLKVILFLPNIICYVLEWTERKLNV